MVKTFCEQCRDDVSCQVVEKVNEREVKGKMISYVVTELRCDQCGGELYSHENHDMNLQRFSDAYRKSENLITVEEIHRILNKYEIGKRPLSQLLGWGDVTLTRYVDGDLPSKVYSTRLLALLDDPYEMQRLVEANGNVLSGVTLRKVTRAVSQLIDAAKVVPVEGKMDEATLFLINVLNEVTPLALQKMLYYAQGFYYMFHHVFMFEEDCEAWVHGPVYSRIYGKYKEFGFNPIEDRSVEGMSFNRLTDGEKEMLTQIAHAFGCYSGQILAMMTHRESPWLNARAGMDEAARSTTIIPREAIAEYFSKVGVERNFVDVTDIRRYSADMFREVYCG